MKHDARRFARFGKLRVFGEKAITGMDGLCAASFRCGDYLVDGEIAVFARRRANVVCLIGISDVESQTIRVGINGDRRNIHLFACAHDPDRDFTTVGNQNLLEHLVSFRPHLTRLAPLEREIAVLFGRNALAFVGKGLERGDQFCPCILGLDNIVDIPELRCDIGIGKFVVVLFDHGLT